MILIEFYCWYWLNSIVWPIYDFRKAIFIPLCNTNDSNKEDDMGIIYDDGDDDGDEYDDNER